MLTYNYDDFLAPPGNGSWTADDGFEGRDFDFSRNFLPERLAGVEAIRCLSADEKRSLNQIRGHGYCQIFVFVEDHVLPVLFDNAQRDVCGEATRLRLLLRFAEKKASHQNMLKRGRDRIEVGLGIDCAAISARQEIARVLRDKSALSALLLISMIEWFTQRHYLEHQRAPGDLDELFREILRHHWINEARNAKSDSRLVAQFAATLSAGERDAAVDELLELAGVIDGLLARQIVNDIANLEKVTHRHFSAVERAEIQGHQHRAYRWTFLVSGLEHGKFVELMETLSRAGADRVAAAAAALRT